VPHLSFPPPITDLEFFEVVIWTFFRTPLISFHACSFAFPLFSVGSFRGQSIFLFSGPSPFTSAACGFGHFFFVLFCFEMDFFVSYALPINSRSCTHFPPSFLPFWLSGTFLSFFSPFHPRPPFRRLAKTARSVILFLKISSFPFLCSCFHFCIVACFIS